MLSKRLDTITPMNHKVEEYKLWLAAGCNLANHSGKMYISG